LRRCCSCSSYSVFHTYPFPNHPKSAGFRFPSERVREESEDNSFGSIVHGSWFAPLNFIVVVINDMAIVLVSQRSRSALRGDRDHRLNPLPIVTIARKKRFTKFCLINSLIAGFRRIASASVAAVAVVAMLSDATRNLLSFGHRQWANKRRVKTTLLARLFMAHGSLR